MNTLKTMKKLIFIAAFAIAVLCIGGSIHVSAKDVTLKAKKWANGVTAEKYSDNDYYKIKIAKTGYIKVEYHLDRYPEDAAEVGILLYDGKRKLIAASDGDEEVKKETAYFAVKKGTYYLQAQTESEISYDESDMDDSGNQPFRYKIRYTFSSFKESGKKITKLSKAPELKKNKKIAGLMFPGGEEGEDTTYALYKITISQKQQVTFRFELGDNHIIGLDKIRFTLLDEKGRELYDGKYKKNAYTWYENGTYKETLVAGTYYISVDGLSTDSTGYYRISWK